MPKEKTSAEFEDVVKEEAGKYKLEEDKLREKVEEELYARVAREIVENKLKGVEAKKKKIRGKIGR